MTTHEFSINPVHQFGAEGASPDNFQFHHSTPTTSSHTPDSTQRGVMQQAFGPPGGEVKPRLTKEQTDVLEANFRANPKPNTQTKREFASDLKVPLDKVNNWFQNRRAKVKQDLKKAQGMGIAAFAHGNIQDYGQMTPEQYKQYAQMLASHAFISQDHSEPHPSMFPANVPSSAAAESQIPVDQNMVLSSNDMSSAFGMTGFDTSMDNAQQGPAFSFSQADQYQLPGHALMNGSAHMDQPAAYASNMDPFVGSEYGMQLQAARSDSITSADYQQATTQQAGHGFPAIDTSSVQGPFRSGSEMSAVDSVFTGWSSEKHGSLSVSPHDQGQGQFENPNGIPRHNRMVSQPNEHFGLFTSMNNGDNPNGTPDSFVGNRMIHQRTFSSPVISVSAAPDCEPQFPADQPLAFPEEAFARRGSSTTELADSMGNVDIDPEHHQMNGFRKPNGPSSLALRRQKRPAALGDPAALRSMSYCGPLTSSPSQNLAPDSRLRRIKSTAGLPNGVVSGRVQKAASSQRSPVHFSFAESGSSPKFSAQIADYSSVTTPGDPPSTASAAPPTPLTPQDAPPRFPAWQNQRTATFHPQIQGQNPGYEGTSEFSPQLASPPTTPMYGGQLARARAPFIPEDTPPQSAPAQQQCFPRASFVPTSNSSPDAMALYAFPDMPNMVNNVQRRPSLPETNPFSSVDTHVPFPVPLPMINQDGQLGLDYPLQWAQGVLDQSQLHEMQFQHQTFMGRHPSSSSTSSAPVPQKPMGELNVSMWQPPNPVAPADQQPKGQDNQTKNFTFQNTGPENYEKQSSTSS
ncbi:MAG: hypothetical protein Q9157_008013 [Trypethelium eluteriae]